MIILLSPAKSLDFESNYQVDFTSNRFTKETTELVNIMKSKSANQIKKMMRLSDKLAQLNYDRYQGFSTRHSKKNAQAAIYAFTGDVYQGLDASSFDKEDLAFAQDHLRILSGLYGLIRPMDPIQPYRLEMGTTLKNQKGKSLYDFWGDQITNQINKDIKTSKGKSVLNLASNEYYKAVNEDLLTKPVYHIHFREYRNDELKFISFNAKKARGYMAAYAIKHRISEIQDIKNFNEEGYGYLPEKSNEFEWFFVR